MIGSVVTWLGSGLFQLLSWLLSLLPDYDWPDLAAYLSGFSSYLANLNWLVPVGTLASLTLAWAVAVLGYNVFLVFSSWLKSFKG